MKNTKQKPKEILELEAIYQIQIEEKQIGVAANNTYIVNANGEVTKLDLAYNALKEIKGFENFTSLDALDLSSCQLKEIKGLDNLVNLKTLNLCDNEITKITGLDNLIKLDYLDLSGNPLKIKELEHLSNLTITNLTCHSDLIIPDEIYGYKSLAEILDNL
ncbi:hypothetical protein FACS1894162_3800 [Bacteroidia bacterium]|nr:hypothetical protein FACS1894162_3800 [Bacteroidia bacterium]